MSGWDGKMDCTSVRSYTRGVWQIFYLCLSPRSNGQPSCCVQGHRVLPLDKPSAHEAISSIINFQGDLWHSIPPALSVWHCLICIGPVPASYRAASFQSNEHFVHFQFISCLLPPLRDATLPDTLPSLPRDLHQRRTLPTSEGVLASGGGGTTTKGHIFTELYCPTAPVSGHSDHRRQDEGCCHPNSHKSEF